MSFEHKIKIHQDACSRFHEEIEGYIPETFHNYTTSLHESLSNFRNECKELLKLTGQKSISEYTDSFLRKRRNCEEKLRKAAALSRKRKITPETPLDKLRAMNSKYKKNNIKSNEVTPEKSSSLEKSVSRNLNVAPMTLRTKKRKNVPSSTDYPYYYRGITHTTFFLEEGKKYVLPNPAHTNKDYPNTYSMREVVLYLHEYRGMGSHKVFQYMTTTGRVF